MFYSITPLTGLFRRIGFLESQFVYSGLENYSFALEQIKALLYLGKLSPWCSALLQGHT